ncbi:BRCA1-associated protein-like [Orbicella faveolata]|uniref:BRCA1-associated protein-like n=1 Tax=Orbicella faveolata TaxID=48498 RepID=UPI0009E2EA45|nr:BRCA1-associated protein-like [Orbicella faveolata]
MSISLVVLRFEVADDLPLPQGLDYSAPGFVTSKDMSASEEGNCTGGEEKDPAPSNVSEEKMKVHRGGRYPHDIHLETLARNSDAAHGEEREEKGKVAFFCGNPMVEIIKGIIHIYKNNEMTSLSEGVKRSEMICMLAVPAKMTCIELMQFVAPSEEFIECVKIIRDATPNQYMVLVKFRSQELADEFYNTFNGQPYNLLEEEVCHLVYVAKVETKKLSEGGSLPCVGLTELPKCPVCLERMDESVEGVLTILCNHSFHGSCLSKWSDTTCPVCRYCQTPQPVDGNKCFECDSNESLWICLICGHIGCGRYLRSHAKRHFQETQHTYSLELGTQRVWDYTGDNFVHRLIQNKADGKLVEYGSGQQVMDEEKMDSVTLEYTYLLTSQLENQRLYFQEKITQIEKEAAEQASSMEERTKKTLEECKRLELKLSEAEKEKKNVDKKYAQVVTRVGKLVSDLKEEQELNKCLLENQKLWQEKLKQTEEKLLQEEAARKQEVSDLQEQLADLMRHLETQQAIASAPDETRQELQDGQIVVGEGSSSTHQSKKTRRKNKT